MKLVLFCDGASRGNPGPAGAGAVLYDEAGTEVAALTKALGTATNNEAEYNGLLLGLHKALALGAKRIWIRADSEVLVKHLRGEYRVKASNLRPLYQEARSLLLRFEAWEAQHVYREQNRRADELSNAAIDRPSR